MSSLFCLLQSAIYIIARLDENTIPRINYSCLAKTVTPFGWVPVARDCA